MARQGSKSRPARVVSATAAVSYAGICASECRASAQRSLSKVSACHGHKPIFEHFRVGAVFIDAADERHNDGATGQHGIGKPDG